MRKIPLLFCFIFAISCVHAQFDLRMIGKNESRESARERSFIPESQQKQAQNKRNREAIRRAIESGEGTARDSVVVTLTTTGSEAGEFLLFRDVVRRYTWLEGLGEPISQEVANHLPYYYKLSMKNEAGHYQLVEAMHGSELTTGHNLSPYILDKNNDTAARNSEWRERLLTVGQWLFAADLTGENVLEERAYEAKSTGAKLVYAMQPVRNDATHVTITYMDAWGFPADMNEDEDYTYGSVIYITYDRNGCDSIIDFLDGAGYRKPNTNGVDQQRCVYDDKGRQLLVTSNSCVGDYVTDNWGNCGARYTYHDADGSYSIVCLDKDLQPMRMPEGRASVDDTFIRCDYRVDRWGRVSEIVYLTAEGEDDATLSGIHRVEYDYSDDGRRTAVHYYDIHNNPMQSE